MKLIVGLGNKGREYDNTRHNVGFMVLDYIANYYHVGFDREKFSGLYTTFYLNSEKIMLLKPQKYMNLSGEVVRDFVQFFHIAIEDILVIHDDLDLSLGRIKLRPKGSSGGHNGLKNIENHLHSQNYKRVKIGIANDKSMDTKDYVLGKLTNRELEIINTIIKKMPVLLNDYIEESFDSLMNKYNQK